MGAKRFIQNGVVCLVVSLLTGCLPGAVSQVGSELQSSVGPNVTRLAKAIPIPVVQRLAPNPDSIELFPRNARVKRQKPLTYFLVHTDERGSCQGLQGEQNSFLSAVFIDKINEVAYDYSSSCQPANQTPSAEFSPEMAKRHWLSDYLDENLVTYRNRIYWEMGALPNSRQLEEIPSALFLCESQDQKVAFLAKRKKGETIGLIANRENDRVLISNPFLVDMNLNDPSVVHVQGAGGAVLLDYLSDQSVEANASYHGARLVNVGIKNFPGDRTQTLRCVVNPAPTLSSELSQVGEY